MDKKILCTGTFDGVHAGHLNYFEQAKQYGNYLIVVIAKDSNAKKEGKTPKYTEQERLEQVKKQKIVDKAIIGNEDKLKVVEEEKPDIILLGYDQKIDETRLKETLAKRGLHPQIIRAKPYHPEKYKSSLLNNNLTARHIH